MCLGMGGFPQAVVALSRAATPNGTLSSATRCHHLVGCGEQDEGASMTKVHPGLRLFLFLRACADSEVSEHHNSDAQCSLVNAAPF